MGKEHYNSDYLKTIEGEHIHECTIEVKDSYGLPDVVSFYTFIFRAKKPFSGGEWCYNNITKERKKMLKYNYYLKDKNMKIFHSVSDNREIEDYLQAINRLVLVAQKK